MQLTPRRPLGSVDLVVAAGFIAPSQHWARLEPRSAAGGAAGDAVISWVLYALFRRRWQGCPGCCWQGGCPGVASLCPPSPPRCHPATCHGASLKFISQGSARCASSEPPWPLWLPKAPREGFTRCVSRLALTASPRASRGVRRRGKAAGCWLSLTAPSAEPCTETPTAVRTLATVLGNLAERSTSLCLVLGRLFRPIRLISTQPWWVQGNLFLQECFQQRDHLKITPKPNQSKKKGTPQKSKPL